MFEFVPSLWRSAECLQARGGSRRTEEGEAWLRCEMARLNEFDHWLLPAASPQRLRASSPAKVPVAVGLSATSQFYQGLQLFRDTQYKREKHYSCLLPPRRRLLWWASINGTKCSQQWDGLRHARMLAATCLSGSRASCDARLRNWAQRER